MAWFFLYNHRASSIPKQKKKRERAVGGEDTDRRAVRTWFRNIGESSNFVKAAIFHPRAKANHESTVFLRVVSALPRGTRASDSPSTWETRQGKNPSGITLPVVGFRSRQRRKINNRAMISPGEGSIETSAWDQMPSDSSLRIPDVYSAGKILRQLQSRHRFPGFVSNRQIYPPWRTTTTFQ